MISIGAAHQTPLSVPAVTNPRLKVQSPFYGNNITDVSGGLAVGTLFTVDIAVQDAGMLTGFDIAVGYNLDPSLPTPLLADSVTLASGVFNGNGLPSNCQPYNIRTDLLGAPVYIVRIAEVILGGCQVDGTNGVLYSITFQVTSVGATSLDVRQASAGQKNQLLVGGPSNSVILNIEISGAYFRNQPGIPPIARFSYNPLSPSIGDEVTFNGTTSYDPYDNNGASRGLSRFIWSFTDGIPGVIGSPANATIVKHVFRFTLLVLGSGYFSVRLVVIDSDDNLPGVQTLVIFVDPTQGHDIVVSVSTNLRNYAVGSPVQVIVGVGDKGSTNENAKLNVTCDCQAQALASNSIIPVPVGDPTNYYYSVQTNNLSPGTYTVTASVQLVNATDNNPSDNIDHVSFRVNAPPPAASHSTVDLIVETGATYFPGDKLVVYIDVTLNGTAIATTGLITQTMASVVYPDGRTTVNLSIHNINEGLFQATYNIPSSAPVGTYLIEASSRLSTGEAVFSIRSFQVKLSDLSLRVDSGTIYFPGDTATFYVTTTNDGIPIATDSLQLTLVRPDNTTVALRGSPMSTGVYKVTYQLPTSKALGVYDLTATAQKQGYTTGTSSLSFEVKPTWLSSQANKITSAVGVAGLLGTLVVAWRRGYLSRRKHEEQTSSSLQDETVELFYSLATVRHAR